MSESILKSVLKESVELELKQNKKNSLHLFSRRHKREMRKIFGADKQPFFVFNKNIPLKKRVILSFAIALIALTGTIASGAAIRGITQKHYSDHAVLRANYSENDPVEIETEYQLGYIPDGYVLYESNDTTFFIYKFYVNSDTNKIFTYSQEVKRFFKTYTDNEHCEFETLEIDGNQALWVGKEKYGTIYLDKGDYIFTVNGHFTKEELIDFARSIEPVE